MSDNHEYANIDEEIIVSTINEDIPELKQAIERLQIKPPASFSSLYKKLCFWVNVLFGSIFAVVLLYL